MNTEAHLAAGWILAHAAGAEDRRFRTLVTLAAVLPDVDALSYVLGPETYGHIHHSLGHNVFFSLIVSAASACLYPTKRRKVFWWTQIAFYSHYFGDYFFTKFPLLYFWPASHAEFVYSYKIGLDHWVNDLLSYLSFLVIIVYGMIYHRTPVEMLSPELDRRIVNLFRRKPMGCHVCGAGANETCINCKQPCYMRHGKIGWRFVVRCAPCARV
jgi:membrane-bound metal-dependent hydrolase YbcI (DUF457 family)